MPKSLLLHTQRQMHNLCAHDVLIDHAPQFDRQLREEGALVLRVRTRINLDIRLRRQADS
jgi:hypothetical protein